MMIRSSKISIFPSPLVFLCLVVVLQTLRAGLSSESSYVVWAKDDYDLINPVNDLFDYEDPDKGTVPEPPNEDLDKLRPDDSGKPDANTGNKDDGKNGGNKDKNNNQNKNDEDKNNNDNNNDNNDNNDNNNDNGKKNKLNDKLNGKAEKIDLKDDNNDNNDNNDDKMTDDFDADAGLVDTAGGADLVQDPQGVTIVDGVAVVPAVVNASIVATVPEILPPMPVDAGMGIDNETLAIPPATDTSSLIEPVVVGPPAATTGGIGLVHVGPWVGVVAMMALLAL